VPSLSTYHEFQPGPALVGAVECFWSGTTGGSATPIHHRVLPDGCMDLLFNFAATTDERVSVVGTMSRALTFVTTGPVDYLGVRFRPGALPAFVDIDAAGLMDEQVSLADFWGARAGELWHRLAVATVVDRVRRLREFLSDARRAATDPFINHCVGRIEAVRGELRIAALEATTGVTTRQLERKFARHVGVSPKLFARIVRFKAVAAAARASVHPPDWARLAAEFGFADQPHLAREFRAMSGLTPRQWLGDEDQPAQNVGFLQDA
jgi:AraC-like DNA-binding protein